MITLVYQFDNKTYEYDVDRFDCVKRLKKWFHDTKNIDFLIDYVIERDLEEIDLLMDFEEVLHELFLYDAMSQWHEELYSDNGVDIGDFL
jgi:hypothetical protein